MWNIKNKLVIILRGNNFDTTDKRIGPKNISKYIWHQIKCQRKRMSHPLHANQNLSIKSKK